jgi:hypothetical protein
MGRRYNTSSHSRTPHLRFHGGKLSSSELKTYGTNSHRTNINQVINIPKYNCNCMEDNQYMSSEGTKIHHYVCLTFIISACTTNNLQTSGNRMMILLAGSINLYLHFLDSFQGPGDTSCM